MDLVVVVSAPSFLQRRRVMRRPGMSPRRFHRLSAAQLPDYRKRAQADVVISTARPKWQTRADVMRLVACLRRSLRR
ncbi:MAG: dephospho-CoA kinase, partial [Sphingomonadales bacterium]|nr:dephospho-CoA kinase [Sphingomonadales bacterium]